MIRLHQLEGFYYAGLAEGYASGAAAMPSPITAPGIYQQVRKLERALGKPLLRQASKRRAVLTPEGRALHRFVAPFFKGLPAVVEGLKRGEASRLVVAVHGALAREAIAPAVAALRARRPGLEVRIWDGDENHVVRAVASSEADAGLAVLGLSSGALHEDPLFAVKVALAVPAAHPWAKRRRPPSPTELDGVPLCVYEKGKAGRALLEAAFEKAGIQLVVAAEANTVETLRALVAAGVAPAFVPVVRARPASRRSREGVVELDVTGLLPGGAVRYGLLTRAGAPGHSAVIELRRLLVH